LLAFRSGKGRFVRPIVARLEPLSDKLFRVYRVCDEKIIEA